MRERVAQGRDGDHRRARGERCCGRLSPDERPEARVDEVEVEVALLASSSDPAAGSDRRGRARQRVNVAAARLDDRGQRVAGDGVGRVCCLGRVTPDDRESLGTAVSLL
jgi:hypothetical protein